MTRALNRASLAAWCIMTGEKRGREDRVQVKCLGSISTNVPQRLAADSLALPVDLKLCTTEQITERRAAPVLFPTDRFSLSLNAPLTSSLCPFPFGITPTWGFCWLLLLIPPESFPQSTAFLCDDCTAYAVENMLHYY